MSNIDTSKKPARQQDWHRADIKAALEKRGYSLARLSRLNGYSRGAAQCALHMHWPRMERLIATTIGMPVQAIWPSRYHADGTRKSERRERGLARQIKDSTACVEHNVQQRRAA